MIVKIILNTDGFLGGYIIPHSHERLKLDIITEQKIEDVKKRKSDNFLVVYIPVVDMPLFNKSIIGRDNVEVLSRFDTKADATFGMLKLKFNDKQNQKAYSRATSAHKKTYESENHRLNTHEKMIKEFFKV